MKNYENHRVNISLFTVCRSKASFGTLNASFYGAKSNTRE